MQLLSQGPLTILFFIIFVFYMFIYFSIFLLMSHEHDQEDQEHEGNHRGQPRHDEVDHTWTVRHCVGVHLAEEDGAK